AIWPAGGHSTLLRQLEAKPTTIRGVDVSTTPCLAVRAPQGRLGTPAAACLPRTSTVPSSSSGTFALHCFDRQQQSWITE
ncbi:MAG: hypothetical protein KJ749_04905, partial [Planctomycetes bacterium]|nr:hypothetical protein [Planctomycetota bacterium]